MSDFMKAVGHPLDSCEDDDLIRLSRDATTFSHWMIGAAEEFQSRCGPWASHWMMFRDGSNELAKNDPKD